jgi:hypothetical protein
VNTATNNTKHSIYIINSEKPQPNFLFFVTDQLQAARLGCYGAADIQTPAIDGLLFSRTEDPHESRNLWDEPAFSKIKAKLLQQLLYQCVCTDRLDQQRFCSA